MNSKIISVSPDITIQQYDEKIYINGGVSMPLTPNIGQVWYANDHIAVWNGYSWINVSDNTQTTNIGTSYRLTEIIQWAHEKMLAEAEEDKFMKEHPEILDAYTEYKHLIDSAKLVAKMRNSPLAQTGS
jgi:hypothetical protein